MINRISVDTSFKKYSMDDEVQKINLSKEQDKVLLNTGNKGEAETELNAGISERMVINAIEKTNKLMMPANRELEFSVHEKTKQIMVKVLDSSTKEVIREIPSEKILDMVANALEMAGILVDEKR